MSFEPTLRPLSALVALMGMVFFVGCEEEPPSGPEGFDVVAHHAPGHGGGGGDGGSNEFSATIEVRNASGDRITSQGSSTYQDDVDGNLRIRDDGILLWNVDEGRGFILDFTDPERIEGDGLPADNTVTRVGALRVLASENPEDELEGHLLGMGDGESLAANLKTRAEFDADGTYSLRFQRLTGDATINDSIATGSSFLTIVRNGDSGPCSTVEDECWTIEAPVTNEGPGTQDDWGIVIHSAGNGANKTVTDEGSFHMPFRWTVVCPDCPAVSTDDSPPSVTVTSPTDGDTVAGTIDVTADATDDGSVTQVEFLVDGSSIGTDSDGSDGWSVSWSTTDVTDGDHTLSATATDDGGQTASDQVSVTVDNVDDPPAVAITNPADGSTVSGSVDVTADASDDGSVSQVEFFVDGASLAVDSDGSDGWSASWDTNGLEDGSSHTVSAEATDDGGQTASDEVTVTVDNSEPSTLHIGDLDGSSTSQGRTWTAFVDALVLDSGGNPVTDATVSGSWSTGASTSCTTDSTGVCNVSEGGIHKRNGNVTFTVDNVVHADLAYDSSANGDPDGDSDGTTITVSKP